MSSLSSLFSIRSHLDPCPDSDCDSDCDNQDDNGDCSRHYANSHRSREQLRTIMSRMVFFTPRMMENYPVDEADLQPDKWDSHYYLMKVLRIVRDYQTLSPDLETFYKKNIPLFPGLFPEPEHPVNDDDDYYGWVAAECRRFSR